MRSIRAISLKVAILTVGLSWSALSSSAVEISSFPDASLGAWKEQSFVGNTQYELQAQDGKNVLKATANRSASVLYKETAIDLTKTPWLDWSWKSTSTYMNINEQSKDGDDYPARLYVTAKTGPLPWQTIAINYVWSSHMPLNSV